MERENTIKIRCPVCGYLMPVFYNKGANCHGVFVTCKGRHCKARFEVLIENGRQAQANIIAALPADTNE